LRRERDFAERRKHRREGGVQDAARPVDQNAEAIRSDEPRAATPAEVEQLVLTRPPFRPDFGEAGGDDDEPFGTVVEAIPRDGHDLRGRHDDDA
jgi:hypothetical protein